MASFFLRDNGIGLERAGFMFPISIIRIVAILAAISQSVMRGLPAAGACGLLVMRSGHFQG